MSGSKMVDLDFSSSSFLFKVFFIFLLGFSYLLSLFSFSYLLGTVYTGDENPQGGLGDICTCETTLASAYVLCYLLVM